MVNLGKKDLIKRDGINTLEKRGKIGDKKMPNRKAKDRKIKRRKLNERWKAEGRTAVQHKKWLEKKKEKLLNPFGDNYGS